ncbi:response regulator [Pseudomonas lalucatii]|nr:response regulator [Pseudomonas lalucatii]
MVTSREFHDLALAFNRMSRALSQREQERQQAEQGLLQAKEAAEKANQAKSDFLAHVTHEIRSPLNAMMGCVDLLAESALNDSQQLYIESAQQSASVLLALINNILDFARIESGALDLVSAPFDLVELCESALAVKALQLSDRQIDLGMLYEPDLPRRCLGDEARLRQVLLNLIDNAIKFTREGGVILRLQLAEREGERFTLECSVSDTGIGIPALKQAAIFEAFTQVDSTDATLHGGAGLGLSICSRLVEAMGGSIRLDSSLGQGSTFSFRVPLGIVEDGPAPRPLSGNAWVVSSNSVLADVLVRQLNLFGLSTQACAGVSGAPETVPGWLFLDAAEALDAPARHRLESVQRAGARLVLMADRKRLATSVMGPGSGSCEVIEKPVCYSRLLQLLELAPRPSRSSGTAAPAPRRQGRILLAEDSPANQLVAVTQLEQAGYQVAVAENGHQVLELLGQASFDLVLMDVRMPSMDGLEATRRIREGQAAYAAIPIIALTANAMREDTQRCRAVGMNGFVGKPFTRESLLQAIDGCLVQADPSHTEADTMSGLKLMDEAILTRLAAETSDAMLERMIGLFVNEAQRRMDAIHEHLARLDCHGVEDEAHTLKSNAATFGASQLSALAREIESACKRMDRERVAQLLPETSDTCALPWRPTASASISANRPSGEHRCARVEQTPRCCWSKTACPWPPCTASTSTPRAMTWCTRQAARTRSWRSARRAFNWCCWTSACRTCMASRSCVSSTRRP